MLLYAEVKIELKCIYLETPHSTKALCVTNFIYNVFRDCKYLTRCGDK